MKVLTDTSHRQRKPLEIQTGTGERLTNGFRAKIRWFSNDSTHFVYFWQFISTSVKFSEFWPNFWSAIGTPEHLWFRCKITEAFDMSIQHFPVFSDIFGTRTNLLPDTLTILVRINYSIWLVVYYEKICLIMLSEKIKINNTEKNIDSILNNISSSIFCW